MTIFLDTNTCVAILNDRPPIVRARARTVGHGGERLHVPAIVAFELWFGVAKSSRAAESRQALAALFATFPVVAFEDDDAAIAGGVRAALAAAGTPIGPYDVLIAAQALRHGATLVTANEREFGRVAGLRIENWAA